MIITLKCIEKATSEAKEEDIVTLVVKKQGIPKLLPNDILATNTYYNEASIEGIFILHAFLCEDVSY